MNKTILAIIILVVAGFLIYTLTHKTSNSQNNSKPKGEKMSDSKYKFPGILPDAQIKNKKAVIKTGKGTIEIELYAHRAPKTVSNFVYLANQKFYNGLTFHRVVPGFVIQGGDPTGSGAGGPGYQFDDEPVVGDYVDGAVAMANAGPNTNGSQFFICLGDQSANLSKSYNLFGQVTSGIDVIKNIAVGDKIDSITIMDK